MKEREPLKFRKGRPSRLWILGIAVWALAVGVWIIEADEDEITIGAGEAPTVASDDLDHSIVAWQSSDVQIVVQAFRMGATVGAPFRISSSPAAEHRAASAHLTENEFVVAWEEDDGTGPGVAARRVKVEDPLGPMPAMGATVGAPIQITTSGIAPAVDADQDGNFVVAWTAPAASPLANDGSGSNYRHMVARLSRMGATVGAPLAVGSAGPATPADVARRPDGDFLVVWEDRFRNIRGTVVDDSGDVVRDDFRVNHLRLGHQSSPAVADLLDGYFTVVWDRKVLGLRFVVGRRVLIDGSPLGDEFLVSLSASTVSTDPAVAADAWGRGYVTWTSRRPFHGTRSILGRQLDLDGAVGPQIVISSPGAVVSSIDRTSTDHDFVVVWESQGNGGPEISGGFIQLPLP